MKAASSIAVATAASLFLAGCSSETFHPENLNGGLGSAKTETMSATFSDELPKRVAAAALNAVAFNTPIPDSAGDGNSQSYDQQGSKAMIFSGVRISTTEYLGPGHGVIDNTTKQFIDGLGTCNTINIDAKSVGPTATLTEPSGTTELYGVEEKSDKLYTPYQGVATTPDVAIFSTDAVDTKEVPFTAQAINTQPVVPGEKLYFANYEPAPDKIDRTPYERDLMADSNMAAYASPAETAGVVLGQEKDGDLEVLVGMKSYGAIDDPYIRGGASGGATFAADGSLIGLSDEADYNTKTNEPNTLSVKQIEKEYSIKLSGVAAGTKLEIAIVQPVSDTLLAKLRTGLAKSAHCVEPTE